MVSQDTTSWFTDLEGIAYAFVEYIPLVGTLYSFSRTRRAHREGDFVREVASVTNLIQGSIRDAVLLTGTAEIAPVVVVHAALEGLTDKLADVFATGQVQSTTTTGALDQNKKYILFAGSTKDQAGQTKARFEVNEHLGIHHFHGSLFKGKLNYTPYAENENIFVSLPDGISDKARCDVTWTWTKDASGTEKSPGWVMSSKMNLLGSNRFEFVPEGEGTQWHVFGFYHFRGEVRDGGKSIRFEMINPQLEDSKTVANIDVYRIGG
ncbi:hypothetical protein VNI00_013196 [Paramarasmius palmivorus]|uniref:Uncharacterized protein n=1 Tax=Paramarasmius palmivorus TaxID=297713 RepID=A0AAW0BYH3_9AGAR